MPEFVYVVMGWTGPIRGEEEEWPVAAFFDEAAARERARLATARAKEISAPLQAVRRTEEELWISRWNAAWLAASEEVNEYDPDMRLDIESASYEVLAVRFVGP